MTENEQVRKVLNDNPTLPITLLTPGVSDWGDYVYYYHEGIEAKVEQLVYPRKLEEKYDTTFGLNYDRVYDDPDDAREDIADWLYDCSDEPWENDDDYDRIAEMITDDLPWEETVVIWGCL